MFETLKEAAGAAKDTRIEDLFAADPERAERFSCAFEDTVLDYSKTQIDDAARATLLSLAEQADVAGRRDAMFSGAAINETEGRAVLHTALRNLDGGPVEVAGEDVMPGVLAVLDRMAQTSGPPWPRKPCAPITTAHASIMSPMWTAQTSPTHCGFVMPKRPW